MNKKKTILYIDGFNLYYGALKSTPYLWLNPTLLASKIFSKNDIVQTKYYSARVQPLPNDPQVDTRQLKYWEALKNLPNFKIIEGRYSRKKVTMKNADTSGFTNVWKIEEKKSDVNLACDLLSDGFNDKYDAAIVITGDSDLVPPIKIVREGLKKTVCVLNPQLVKGQYARIRRNASELRASASFSKHEIDERLLRNSQLDKTIQLSKGGSIHKPSEWCKTYPATRKP